LAQRNNANVFAQFRPAVCLAVIAVAAAALTVGVRPCLAQGSLVDGLNLDKLQIVSLGLSAGRIVPSQVQPATVGAIEADYGEIARNWRIVVGATIWNSRYRDEVVQGFVDALNRNASAGGSGRVTASRISLYDVTFGGDLRYAPRYSGELKPFVGVGLALHVINAEGALINGTFVERALDDVGGGLYVTSGVSLRLFSRVGLEGSLRADLLSGFRSAQGRAGGVYYFGQLRGVPPAATGSPLDGSRSRP
jgi:hypothetical protein